MNNFEYKNLTPFKWFVLENFPFIEADFDALTEWQLFCKLGKEINKIINSENTLGTQMENVTNAFIDLQNYIDNYFDNLDVQDEINNKLNEMAEDGTLENIFNKYLTTKISRTYENVSELINDNTIIKNMIIQTLGYKVLNDGGKAIYKIVDNYEENNPFYLQLNNGLYAYQVLDDEINVLSVGFDNTGTTDNISIFNKLINNTNKPLFFPNGIYNFSNSIIITNNNLKLSKNAELKLISDNIIDNFIKVTNETSYNYYFKLSGGIINGNFKCKNLITFNMTRRATIKDLILKNFTEHGIQSREILGVSGGENTFDNILLINEQFYSNAIAIYENGADNFYDDIVIQDIPVGIYAINNNNYNNIHHWLSKQEYIANSRFAILNNFGTFNNIIIDTVETGFVTHKPSASPIINNCFILANSSVWTNTNLEFIFYKPFTSDEETTVDKNTRASFNNINFYNSLGNNKMKFLESNRTNFPNLSIVGATSPFYTTQFMTNNSTNFDFTKINFNTLASDLNNQFDQGIVLYTPTGSNIPENGYGIALCFSLSGNSGKIQLAFGLSSGNMFYRTFSSNSWTSWRKVSAS